MTEDLDASCSDGTIIKPRGGGKWAGKPVNYWQWPSAPGRSWDGVEVIGVREFGGGDLSTRTEVIGLEAWRENSASTKSAGQALGYSVVADRCYLAKEGSVTEASSYPVPSGLTQEIIEQLRARTTS